MIWTVSLNPRQSQANKLTSDHLSNTDCIAANSNEKGISIKLNQHFLAFNFGNNQ